MSKTKTLSERLSERFIKVPYMSIDAEGNLWLGSKCMGKASDNSEIAEEIADVE